MKKWLKRLGLALLATVVLLLGLAGFLLGTQPGLQWTLETANDFIPGELGFAGLQGSLLGELRIRELEYSNPDTTIQVDLLVLSWSPSELFGGLFHLRELSLDKIRIEQIPAAKEEPVASAAPGDLPDLKLPVDVQLDLLQVTEMEIVSSPEAEPARVDLLRMVAAWDKAGITLTELTLKTPELEWSSKGKLSPRKQYPMEIQTDWRLVMEDVPKIQATGAIAGDLEKLVLQQSFTGDIAAELNADLVDVLDKANWNMALTVNRIPEEFLPPDIKADLLASLKARGDLAESNAQISLRVSEPDKFREAKTGESGKPMEHLLKLEGNVKFADLSFQLQGGWENLQWPLTGSPLVIAETGEISASGTMENYTLALATVIRGDDIPPGNWNLEGGGNLERFSLKKLHGDVLEGSVDVSGDVEWVPYPSWNITMATTDIDPAALDPGWPGKLNLSVSTSGDVKDERLQLVADISELSGTLHERPVAGNGRIRMGPEALVLEGVAFSSGQAKLNADGELGKQWNLAWQLDVPDLADLLPGGEGIIQAQGKLQGSQDSPIVEGALLVQNLVHEGLLIEQGNTEFSLGLDPAHQSNLSVDIVKLVAQDQRLDNLTLKVNGPLERQLIELSAKHPLATLQMASQGGYFEDKQAWEGEVQRLQLESQYDLWTLQAPAPVVLSADKITLSSLCLQEQQTSVCAEADWTPAGGEALATVKGLSLERAKPWLPPQITALSGILNLDARADFGEVLNANVEAVLEPGVLAYLDHASRNIELGHRNGKLTLVLDQQQLAAGLQLDVGEHLATGEFTVPRAELDRDAMTAPLDGKVDIAIRELGLLTALVPDIQQAEGKVDVALILAGVLGDPRISGHADLVSSQVTIPRAGLELRDVLFQVKGEGGNNLKLTGAITSGDGTLKLDGKVSLDATQGWPAQLALAGENFQLANLPEAQILITPDFKLENSKELTTIRGTLFIPRAVLTLHDLPPGSRDASSDVIIVSEGDEWDEEFQDSRVNAEIAVELGEDVRFNGFGLNMDLGGKVTMNQLSGKIPTANGELKIESGSFRAYGQDLTIEEGRISYAGGRLDNPGLRLRASRRISDTTVGVEMTGTANTPLLSAYSSDPDMTEKDAVSMLLTGQKSGDLTAARVYAGKQITEDLSVGVNVGGGEDGSEFVARFRLREKINLEGTSSAKKSGGSINYSFDVE